MGCAPNLWTDTAGLIDRLTALHTAGQLSMRDMAKQLSDEFKIPISRNAIIGKIRRLGLAPAVTRSKKKKAKAKAPKPRTAPRRTQPRIHYVAPPVPKQAPLGLGLSIMQLHGSTCRFPAGTSTPYLFCGLPTIDGCPYCPYHCAMSRQPPPLRQRYRIRH